ncbi:MAG: LysR family transcriptional regulator [Caulobacteraceae bacterium]
MIERYQLRYFLAVVDAGNFTRAAARACVSQPTLSIGIAKLEEALGEPLFIRNSKRVHLTPAGARLLAHARAIDAEFNALERRGSAARAETIRCGVLTSIPSPLLERVLRAFRREDDQTLLEFVEGSERDLQSRLRRGRVDLALTILRRGEDRFTNEALFQEGYALALPAWHRFAREEVIRAEDLVDEVMIVRRHCEALSEISRHFTDRGVRPQFGLRSTNDERVLSLVAAGLGLTVMPASYLHGGVARPKLAGFDLRREVGILYADHARDLCEQGAPIVTALRLLR